MKHHDTSPDSHEQPPQLRPRIYVASLADYNNGILHGRWIDATTDPDTIKDEITDILRSSTQPDAEEFAIHDYDEFGGIRIDEYTPIDDVVALAVLVAKHGEAYASYADSVGIANATEDDFTTCYAGNYESVEAYVDSCLDDWGWYRELETLQANSPIGSYLAIDRHELIEVVWMESDVIHRPNGTVDIFSPR